MFDLIISLFFIYIVYLAVIKFPLWLIKECIKDFNEWLEKKKKKQHPIDNSKLNTYNPDHIGYY